jgi:hypothetical protein
MILRQTGCGESPDGRYTMPPVNVGAAALEQRGGSDARHLRNGADEIPVGRRPRTGYEGRTAGRNASHAVSSRVHPVCLSNIREDSR